MLSCSYMFAFQVVTDIWTRSTYATITVVTAFGFLIRAISFTYFLVKSHKVIEGLYLYLKLLTGAFSKRLFSIPILLDYGFIMAYMFVC